MIKQAALFAALIGLVSMPARSAPMPLSDYKGLYVMIYPSWLPQTSSFENALAKPYIDGATIIAQWRIIEPAPGIFDFSSMDKWIGLAVAQHKKIGIGVMAGCWSPDWLYDTNHRVHKNKFNYNRNPQGTPECTELTLPSAWDPVFVSEYNNMMGTMARHLHELSIAGSPPDAAFDALRIVKIGGINNTTEELRLYSNSYPHGDDGPCNQSDAPPIWLAAGFAPKKIVDAWVNIAQNIASAFPSKIMSIDIIYRSAFPLLDDSGNLYRLPPQMDNPLTGQIIAAGISHFRGRFAVQWNALNNRLSDRTVIEAGKNGAIMAWQMNEFLGPRGGSGRTDGDRRVACKSDKEFQEMMDNGISAGGQFIEIWAPNADQFPVALQNAHDELTQWTRERVRRPYPLSLP